MKRGLRYFCFVSLIFALCSGCAATKTEVAGMYNKETVYSKKRAVRAFFDLYHYKQEIGKDAIPKLLQAPGIASFDDIFKDSLKQISNIDAYRTFTNLATDIEQPKRRDERQSLMKTADYTIRVEILREKSYSKHFIGAIVSSVTLTLIPVGYTWIHHNHQCVRGRQ